MEKKEIEESEKTNHKSTDKKKHTLKIKVKRTLIMISLLILTIICIFLYFKLLKPVTIIDFSKMSKNEIRIWGGQNSVKINFEKEYSEKWKDEFLKQEPESNTKIRPYKNVTVFFSKGREVKTPDFTEYTISDIEKIAEWFENNKISLVLKNDFSEKEFGKIISQQIKPGDLSREGEDFEIVYSVGKRIVVPNFKSMTKEDAKKWADKHDVDVIIENSYSGDTKKGVLISQNVEPESFISKISEVKLLYSLGEEPKKYGEDNYKVGVDIPAGEYIVFAEGGMGYYSITNDANGDDIIDNDNFSYNSIIKLKNGQYVQFSRCYAIAFNEVPELDTSKSGMFKVGKHIKPGEYKLEVTNDSGYYAILSGPNGDNNIISNNNFKKSQYINVKNGQYLELSRCKIVK